MRPGAFGVTPHHILDWPLYVMDTSGASLQLNMQVKQRNRVEVSQFGRGA